MNHLMFCILLLFISALASLFVMCGLLERRYTLRSAFVAGLIVFILTLSISGVFAYKVDSISELTAQNEEKLYGSVVTAEEPISIEK